MSLVHFRVERAADIIVGVVVRKVGYGIIWADIFFSPAEIRQCFSVTTRSF